MIRYSEVGTHKRLSQIVFAGSHDASITGGGKSAKTQSLDIKGQAKAGVRLFDLRILMHKNKDGYSMHGYHGGHGKKISKNIRSTHTGGSKHKVTVTEKMSYGTTGLKLSSMLEQAKDFTEQTGEFLIFKFDKCTNYDLIAQYCTNILGDSIYKASTGTELGRRTLAELSGKVVCVLSDGAHQELSKKGYGSEAGIHGFRNLKGKEDIKPYEGGYTGLQYYGKGGTPWWHVWRSNHSKISQNYSKQKKMMAKMAVANEPQARDVLGMMYWTTTAFTQSIKSRNDQMWRDKKGFFFWQKNNRSRMQDLWQQGLEASISHQLEAEDIWTKNDPKLGKRMRAFFPNIVMIDFADKSKCKAIYELNTIADDLLTKAYAEYMGSDS